MNFKTHKFQICWRVGDRPEEAHCFKSLKMQNDLLTWSVGVEHNSVWDLGCSIVQKKKKTNTHKQKSLEDSFSTLETKRQEVFCVLDIKCIS